MALPEKVEKLANDEGMLGIESLLCQVQSCDSHGLDQVWLAPSETLAGGIMKAT